MSDIAAIRAQRPDISAAQRRAFRDWLKVYVDHQGGAYYPDVAAGMVDALNDADALVNEKARIAALEEALREAERVHALHCGTAICDYTPFTANSAPATERGAK